MRNFLLTDRVICYIFYSEELAPSFSSWIPKITSCLAFNLCGMLHIYNTQISTVPHFTVFVKINSSVSANPSENTVEALCNKHRRKLIMVYSVPCLNGL